ncbi:putative polyketide synthase [Xylariaceae sp. FL0804]|nr:putative polyketide synthase [Xylariaceae sp. FL0804]
MHDNPPISSAPLGQGQWRYSDVSNGDGDVSSGDGYLSADGIDDPVCIIGLACHLPGGVRSPSDMWNFLMSEGSGQGPVPIQRFNINGFNHEDDSRAGVMSADGGYFLNHDSRQFDNTFFGINVLEATYMDPHQRKILEVAYECLENAGMSMQDVSGTRTGVYAGSFTFDYTNMHYRDPDYLHRYSATGSSMAIIANRISHVFNLQGPSLTLNTACSSSLYCLHTAVGALLADDCDTALVASANLIMSPEQHLATMKCGVLSPTSTCHAFDELADGYGRAEGVTALCLKRLSKAQRDKNSIWGIIRGTSVNSNGKGPGIAQPNAEMQSAVINKAYSNANLDMSDTDYVECHGTGTLVGDATEVEALKRCFSRRETTPLMIGSLPLTENKVKPNFGHSEAASGLTSVIKALLSFQHATIPPTIGIDNLRPRSLCNSSQLQVVTEPRSWPRTTRRAGINSFGFGGANSHAILESLESYLGTPFPRTSAANGTSCSTIVLPLSANSSASLESRISQVCEKVQDPTVSLHGLALALGRRSYYFKVRTALIMAPTLAGNLERVEHSPTTQAVGPLKTAFVFSGQGAQYTGMAKELLSQNRVFRETIQELDEVLATLPSDLAPDFSLLQTISGSQEENAYRAVHSQSLCAGIQIGLVNMMRSWGVVPSAVVGHSSGEIAAAYAAGFLTASKSILVAFLRGVALSEHGKPGAMMALGLGPGDAEHFIARHKLTEEVSVACVNDPGNVTLSGSQEGIDFLYATFQRQRGFCRKLETAGQAYHSRLMKHVGPYYEQLIAPYLDQVDLQPRKDHTVTTMYCSAGYNAGDARPAGFEVATARYWRENLEKPVQFASALEALSQGGDYHLIEIGPHHQLKGPIQRIRAKLGQGQLPYSHTLARGERDSLRIGKLAGTLFIDGHNLDWEMVNSLPKDTIPAVDIPPYPWDYSGQLLWKEPRASIELRNRKFPRHELLGSQQLAGNGVDWSWRNILKVQEVPWLQDHKLESQAVFPAAGYLAMVIEAVCQAEDLHSKIHSGTGFEFRNVSFNAAFVIPGKDVIGVPDVELHTHLKYRMLSNANFSKEWFEFTISSWTEGHATIHCVGSIRAGDTIVPRPTSVIHESDFCDELNIERWYDKLKEAGLNFGPSFRSITGISTDDTRMRKGAIATTTLFPQFSSSSPYPLHPLVIDSCFHAGILGDTAGELSSLRAYLPVFIAECRVHNPIIAKPDAKVFADSTRAGISGVIVDCTLRNSENVPVLDMRGVRMSMYAGHKGQERSVQDETPYLQRHPCMRVRWKPDITRLGVGNEGPLRRYLDHAVASMHPDIADNQTLSLMPNMHVLELSGGCGWSAFPHGKLQTEHGSDAKFEVIIIASHAASVPAWEKAPETVIDRLNPDRGIIIFRHTQAATTALEAAKFTLIETGSNVSLAIRDARHRPKQDREGLIVCRELSPDIEKLSSSLSSYLKIAGGVTSVKTVLLSDLCSVPLTKNTLCISLLEIEREILASLSSTEMDLLRHVTDTVTDLLWITGTNALGCSNPHLTMSSGLSRALMLEQPYLRFTILDIGESYSRESHGLEQNVQLICENATSALLPLHEMDDKEFVQSDGLLWVSRFYPDNGLNSLFRNSLGSKTRHDTLDSSISAELTIGKVGVLDTLHFQRLPEPATELRPGFVEIQTKAVGLNAKDVYTLAGKAELRYGTTAHEFSGVVTAIGPDVQDLQVGDRVVAMLPTYFTTTGRVPAWTVERLLPDEDFATMSAILVAYSTAIYALCDHARLSAGETCLIHTGSGALGIAAINIAQNIGAVVYTTAGSEAKREFLTSHFGIPPDHIFNSRDTSFADGIGEATGGRGVDVVLNSLTGDLMHASLDCVAEFGRFVEVGKRDITDAGKMDLAIFQRNVTYSAFDLSGLFYTKSQRNTETYIRLVKETLKWYRSGHIKAGPMRVFDVSEITQAYRYFSSSKRVGKVVVSLENPQSVIQVAEPRYQTVFHAHKVYLLVGCLGGLGRSISRWMATRGARHLVFLGTSGLDNPKAKKLIALLGRAGVTTQVIKGDVLSIDDVKKAIETCVATGKALGGVIQAAMRLHESLFSSMRNEHWHRGIDVKYTGTWNLHAALDGHEEALDFFLLTSSNSGTVGVATEANYCASNGFLDAFARWRREQGKPAVSLGLGMVSEVGYLHENPDIENILLRKGMYPINESEFLKIVDMALQSGADTDPTNAHILTGTELLGFRNLMAKGFDVNNLPLQDPRSGLLAVALEMDQLAQADGLGPKQVGRFAASTAVWAKELPELVSGSLLAESDAGSLQEAVLGAIRRQFSNLILTPLDQIAVDKPLAQFGVDSMIASEFRTWFWASFKVDIPFLDLLSTTKTLLLLANDVVGGVTGCR